MTFKPGDRVIVCETWDYGPPADPYTEHTVLDHRPISFRGVTYYDVTIRSDFSERVYTIPARCVRKPDPITFQDMCAFFTAPNNSGPGYFGRTQIAAIVQKAVNV